MRGYEPPVKDASTTNKQIYDKGSGSLLFDSPPIWIIISCTRIYKNP
jgi:hypothetical protein